MKVIINILLASLSFSCLSTSALFAKSILYDQPMDTTLIQYTEKPLVELNIELIGEKPEKLNEIATFRITLLPRINFDELLFSIKSTSVINIVKPVGFKFGNQFKPIVYKLRPGQHYYKKLINIQADKKYTFDIESKFIEFGNGYVSVKVKETSKKEKIFYSGSFVLYFKSTENKIYTSYQGLEDIYIQFVSDSLKSTGESEEEIKNKIEKIKRSGAKVKIKVTPPDSVKNSEQNSVLIHGYIKFKDEIGNTHPVRFVPVIISDELATFAGNLITDENGYFSKFIEDEDGDGLIRGLNLVIQAQGETAAIVNYHTESVYEISDNDEIPEEIIDGSSINIEITALNEIDIAAAEEPLAVHNQNVAFEIYEAVNYISRYLPILDEALLTRLMVTYPRDGDPDYSDFYKWPTSRIRLAYFDAHDWDNIHHEYGHYLQQIYEMDNWIRGTHDVDVNHCKREYFYKEVSLELAWGEAWPTFFAIMSQVEQNLSELGIPSVGDTYYTDWQPDELPTNYDLELGIPPIYNDEFHAGEACELSIMRSLWDFYDIKDDAGDIEVRSGSTTLWLIFKEYKPHTFSEFWNRFIAEKSEEERIKLGAICAEHRISSQIDCLDFEIKFGPDVKYEYMFDGTEHLGCDEVLNAQYKFNFYDKNFNLLLATPWQFSPDFYLTQKHISLMSSPHFFPAVFSGAPFFVDYIWVCVLSRDSTEPKTGIYYGGSCLLNFRRVTY